MPQLQIENEEIISRILRSTIGVISRRTSDLYASVSIGNEVKNLRSKYAFLEFVEIKIAQTVKFNEVFDAVEVKPAINDVNPIDVAKSINELIRNVSRAIGQEAGYFFIKEIKEEIPYNYEIAIRDMGIDFNTLQLEYLTERKNSFKLHIKNSDVIKNVFKTLFNALEQEENRNFAFKAMDELVTRLSTEYTLLKFVTINDINIVRNVDVISVDESKIDTMASFKVGAMIQKVIQEINNELDDKGGSSFLEKIKNNLNSDYIYRLRDMGVNFDVIKSNQGLVLKHVINALVNVLIDSSTQSYAVLVMNNFLKKSTDRYGHLKDIKIDSINYSEDINAISIPETIESTRESELGRCIQKLIEEVTFSFNEEGGAHFIEKFKEYLGKAYILRIEEMGVNLHMIQLRKDLLF